MKIESLENSNIKSSMMRSKDLKKIAFRLVMISKIAQRLATHLVELMTKNRNQFLIYYKNSDSGIVSFDSRSSLVNC